MSTILGYLAEGLKYVMIFCDKISGQNYWLSLFLFALIIKLVLFPFVEGEAILKEVPVCAGRVFFEP